VTDQAPPPAKVPEASKDTWWSDFFDAFVKEMVSPSTASWLADLTEHTIGNALTILLAFWFKIQTTLVSLMDKAYDQVQSAGAPVIAKLASEGISGFFGVGIGADEIHVGGGATAHDELASKLGGFVLQGLFRSTEGSQGPSPNDGLKNAETLLGLGVNLALVGFITDISRPPIVDRLVPGFRELKEVISANLGLGRLTRRGLSPLLNAHIVNPLTRHLNTLYLPTLLTEAQAARAFIRGDLTEADYFQVMAERGYSRELAGALRAQHATHPSPSQLQAMRDLGLISDEDFRASLRAQGFQEGVTENLLVLARDDHVRAWTLDIATTAKGMFAAREIDEATLDRLLSDAGLSEREKTVLTVLSQLERTKPKRLTLAEMQTAYVEDVVNLDELRAYLEAEGYAEPDVVILQTLSVKRKAAAEAKAEAARPAPPPGTGRIISQAEAAELFRRGITNEAQLRDELGLLGFKGPNLDALVVANQQRRDDYAAALAKHRSPPRGATLPRSTVSEAYVRGLASRSDLQAYLEAQRYAPAAVQLLLALADNQRAAYEARAAKAAAKAAAPTKTLATH